MAWQVKHAKSFRRAAQRRIFGGRIETFHRKPHQSARHPGQAISAYFLIERLRSGHVQSKCIQFLELALAADPGYRIARLGDQMIGAGMVAGWSMDKSTAYRPFQGSHPVWPRVKGV